MCGLLLPKQLDRTAAYETDKYILRAFLISVLNNDGRTKEIIEGLSFMWGGRDDELRSRTFDLKKRKKDRELSEFD